MHTRPAQSHSKVSYKATAAMKITAAAGLNEDGAPALMVSSQGVPLSHSRLFVNSPSGQMSLPPFSASNSSRSAVCVPTPQVALQSLQLPHSLWRQSKGQSYTSGQGVPCDG